MFTVKSVTTTGALVHATADTRMDDYGHQAETLCGRSIWGYINNTRTVTCPRCLRKSTAK